MANPPIKKYTSAGVQVCVWEQEHQKDNQKFTTRSITIDKRYKDQEGNWKSTQSLRMNELPRAIVLLQKAIEEEYIKEAEEDSQPITDQEEVKDEPPKQQSKEQKIQVLTDQFMKGNITEKSFKEAITQLKK